MKLKDYFLPTPKNSGFRMEGYWVWCGSIMKGENGRYYMFASRIPQKQPFHPGWLFESEIVRASSDNPCGPYEFEEVVIGDRGPQYWDGRMAHNPRIMKYKDKYVLYYVGTTYPFALPEDGEQIMHDDYRTMIARANKRIGVAVADRIDGEFHRFQEPMLHTRAEYFDNLLTSNPSPVLESNGTITMLYKSRCYRQKPYKNPLHSDMEFGVATSKNCFSKHHSIVEKPVFTNEVHLEDPFIWKSKKGYHMIAKDMIGNIACELGAGMSAFSIDGVNWELERNTIAYTKEVLWDDGTREHLGSMERPFIFFEKGEATHISFAVSNGSDGYMDATETWNLVIPLEKGIQGNVN